MDIPIISQSSSSASSSSFPATVRVTSSPVDHQDIPHWTNTVKHLVSDGFVIDPWWIPLELKVFSMLIFLFLFLVFLITVLWDRYGKEIGELYTPKKNGPHATKGMLLVIDMILFINCREKRLKCCGYLG